MKTNNNPQIPSEVKKSFDNEAGMPPGQLERVWHLMGEAQPEMQTSSAEEKAAMWARINQKIDTPTLPAAEQRLVQMSRHKDRSALKRNPFRFTTSVKWMSIATSITLLVLSGVLYWKTPVTATALPGQTASITLPDGSVVDLNSGASISYARGFQYLPFTKPVKREIVLNGEAFFDVTTSDVPFIVKTFNAEVAVLGTKFNVRAWPDATNRTAVTLSSGIVQVSATHHPDQHIILNKPGHHVLVTDKNPLPGAPAYADVNAVSIWKEAGFAVNNESLRSVFAELERRFDLSITVSNRITFDDSLTIMLPRAGSINSILDDICTLKALNYRRTSRGFEIY